MKRRFVLFAAPAFVAACAADVKVPTGLAADAALLDTVIQIEGPVLLAKPGLTSADTNNINAAMATVHSAAMALQSAPDLSANAAIVMGIQAIADVATKYVPAGSVEALQIAAAVKIAQLFLPVGTATAGMKSSMSVEDARARLKAMKK